MKIRTIIGGMICAMALNSCNLNESEHSNYDEEYIKLNFSNVGGLVTDIYAKLDYDLWTYSGATMASACDEAEYAWGSNEIFDFFNGSWSPTNAKSSMWTTGYAAIQACNLFLEDYTGLTFPELMLNSDYEAQMFRYNNYQYEVRFLRAYFYFNLIRQYGDVPFFTHNLALNEVNTLSRTSYQSVFDYIDQECTDIADKIIVDYTNLGSNALPDESPESGRVNRLTVMALKARALLYAASPLFNTTNDLEIRYKAAKACKELLDECAVYQRSLGKYTELWGEANWQSNEMIFVRRIGASRTMESYNFPIGVEGGNSGNCPTQTLVDAYEMKATGLLWNEDGSGYDAANPYDGRDPRFEMSIAKNGDTGWPAYNSNEIQTYYGGLNGEPISGATPTGYYLKKYLDSSVDLRASSLNTKRHSWVTYRLGEAYLNYAEAVFRYLGGADATNSEFTMSAREAVNKVRARSGVEMPALPTGLSQDEFWAKYTNERMVELAFEGHRFWDVRRWREGSKLKTITLMKITKNSNGSFSYTRTAKERSWDDKMYFFPIPQSEMMKNSNLVQNPGY